MRRHLWILLLGCLLPNACFRDTGVEIFNVTSSQATDDNIERLGFGKEAIGRTDDFTLQNSNIQVVINGLIGSPSRNLFLEKDGGAIYDLTTQFRLRGSSEVNPRNDDGLSQMTQGVNFNYRTLIDYDRISINQIDQTTAGFVLTGRLYDMDGSLEAAGAAVDARTRQVLGCEVQTTYQLDDLVPIADAEDRDDQFDIDDLPVTYVTITTEVRNTGQTALPIFTVNDIVVTAAGNYEPFVAYPDWGFEQPGGVAYAPYVYLHPRPIETAHYAAFSRMDGMVRVGYDNIPEKNLDVVYVGKAVSDPTIPPGESRTFIREFAGLNGGSNTSTSFSALLGYLELTEFLREMPNSYWSTAGAILFSTFDFGVDQGQVSIEYIGESQTYFDGQSFVQLEPGRSLPIFGDNRIFDSYDMFTGSNEDIRFHLPLGQIQVRVNAINSNEFLITEARRLALSSDDEVSEDPEPIIIDDGEIFNMGVFQVAAPHDDVSFGLQDTSERDLLGRAMVRRTDDQGEVNFGRLPIREQGPVVYLNSVTSSATTNTVTVPLLTGAYEATLTHGPMFDIATVTFDVDAEPDTGDGDGDGGDGANVDNIFNEMLTQVVSQTSLLSADFDVRSSNDPQGKVSQRRLIRAAVSEDLDILFLPSTYTRSRIEDDYRLLSFTLGGFSDADRDGDIESLFDELAVARAFAVTGRVNDAQTPDRGRFAVLNLPRIQDQDIIEPPLFRDDPATFFDEARALGEGVVINVTRPRAPKGLETGYFTAIAELLGLEAGQPLPADNAFFQQTAATGSETSWLDFDLITLLTGNHYDEYLLARQDWFNLLSAGIFKPAVGGTGGGRETKDLPIGAVRTFVSVSDTTLRDNELQSFWTATRTGSMSVSSGPLVSFTLGGAGSGFVINTADETLTGQLRIQAAPWIPIEEVRLIIDGQVVPLDITLNNEEVERFNGSIEVDVPTTEGLHWVVIEVGATLDQLAGAPAELGDYAKVYPGHLPIAFTNPVFISR